VPRDGERSGHGAISRPLFPEDLLYRGNGRKWNTQAVELSSRNYRSRCGATTIQFFLFSTLTLKKTPFAAFRGVESPDSATLAPSRDGQIAVYVLIYLSDRKALGKHRT
jgi:hypothetical protein